MQVQILSGIYGKATPDLRRSYPVNLAPVALENGISKGYLRSAPGVTQTATGPGADWGGIVWKGIHYRAMGTKLVSISSAGVVNEIGEIGSGSRASFVYSFDRLAITSGGSLYLYNGATIRRVTDPDLGPANDVIWIDGRFMTTDGESLVVTELSDPAAVDPLKYGSSEADPDPVLGLLELRGEVVALNANSIEFFYNQGTTGFPFARQRGAQIAKGCVGKSAFAKFGDGFVFVGSGRGEAPSLYAGGGGRAVPISPREVDEDLAALTDEELSLVRVEARQGGGDSLLYIHLPDRTWVFDQGATDLLQIPVWFRLAAGVFADQAYAARGFVWHAGKWWCGDDQGRFGYVDDATPLQFGEVAGYRFDVPLIYNGGAGAIVHELELVALTGHAPIGAEPTIFMSHTDDGATWSAERGVSLGLSGQRDKRPAWRRCGRMIDWRGYRFRGIADAPISFARLEAQVEGLSNGRRA